MQLRLRKPQSVVDKMALKMLLSISLAPLLLSNTTCVTPPENTVTKVVIMKGVGIDIPQDDFIKMKSAGIDILTTEWGMEESVNNVKLFLDRAHACFRWRIFLYSLGFY